MIRETMGRNGAGQRVDRWLRKRFPQAPLSLLFAILRKKKIRINGKVAKAPQMLIEGDVVEIYENMPETTAARETVDTPPHRSDYRSAGWGDPDAPWPEGLDLLVEEDEVLVLHKPAGVPSQPGTGTRPGESLVELLWSRYGESGGFKPQLAHRLDMDTSGLILAARSAPALRELTALIRERRIRKEYLALVSGIPEPRSGRIELKLERQDSARGAKMNVGNGVDASTEYKVEKDWGACSLVRIHLETGRMHQIRAHFAAIGCPLLGDGRYGNFEQNREFKKLHGLRRLFLHSALLAWKGQSGRKHHESGLPPELAAVIASISGTKTRPSLQKQ